MSNRRKLRGKDWEPLARRVRTIVEGREDEARAAIDTVAPGFLCRKRIIAGGEQ
jgi:hypothetical protein